MYINTKPNVEGLTHETGNIDLSRTYGEVDGHIFQSHFNHDLIHRHLGVSDKPNRVISNGTELPISTQKHRLNAFKEYDYVFFAASNWKGRPNKRYEDNVRTFSALRKMMPDMKMVLATAGETGGHLERRGVIALNRSIDQQVLTNLYKSADMFFHLSFIDHCPNAVVEALSHGLPVLCSSSGGTSELLPEDGGVIHKENWTMDVQDIGSPPKVDHEKVAAQVKEYIEKTSLERIDRPFWIDIRSTAARYIEFFEEVLSE